MATFEMVAQARNQVTKRSFRPSWPAVAQVGLAALFVFAGASKLAMPAGELTEQSGFSIEFMRFIATAEVLGGLGLVLPGLVRFQRWLTPLAATGLVAIMIGATAVTAADNLLAAVLPFGVGVAAAFVAVRRRDWLSQP